MRETLPRLHAAVKRSIRLSENHRLARQACMHTCILCGALSAESSVCNACLPLVEASPAAYERLRKPAEKTHGLRCVRCGEFVIRDRDESRRAELRHNPEKDQLVCNDCIADESELFHRLRDPSFGDPYPCPRCDRVGGCSCFVVDDTEEPPLTEFGWACQIATDVAEMVRTLCAKHSRELGTLPMGAVCELAMAAIDGLWAGDNVSLGPLPDSSDGKAILAAIDRYRAERGMAHLVGMMRALTRKREELEQVYAVEDDVTDEA